MQDLHGTSYLPRAEARNPSGRRQPVPDRTLGAQGQRPGGAINPRGEAASTFGNTGKHRPGPGPDPDCAERRLNPRKKAVRNVLHFFTAFLFPYSFCSSASGAGASSSGVPSSSVSSAGTAVSAASPVSSGSSASTAGVSSFFSSTGG